MLELNKIHQGDSAELMKKLPENFIDLTITSPPYDNLRNYNGYSFDFKTIAKELFRITKEGGVVVWVVGDSVINRSESGTSFRQALGFIDVGFKLHDTMIYQKNGMSGNPDKNRYYQSFEYMFILVKGKLKTFNGIEDRKNKWSSSWGRKHFRNKDGTLTKGEKIICKEYGRRFNIWKFNTGAGFTTKDKFAYKHPAMFPEQLAEDHIISWSDKGDLVFDPFVGSGTTCKMALKNNRKFVGFEISEEYCKIAEARINKAKEEMGK